MASSTRLGVFAGAPIMPPTVIFHLTSRFKADTHPKKLNLGVGAYRDEQLRPVVWSSVRKAEAALAVAGNDKEYLPIAGLAEFRTQSAKLLFGASHAVLTDGRLVTAQTLSGTGSLTIAAHTIRRVFPVGTRVFCSDPTWENHNTVVFDAGLGQLETYRYWDHKTRGLDFTGMMADLKAVPEGSVILLHAVAHNPTGVDPTKEQCECGMRAAAALRSHAAFSRGDLTPSALPSAPPPPPFALRPPPFPPSQWKGVKLRT